MAASGAMPVTPTRTFTVGLRGGGAGWATCAPGADAAAVTRAAGALVGAAGGAISAVVAGTEPAGAGAPHAVSQTQLSSRRTIRARDPTARGARCSPGSHALFDSARRDTPGAPAGRQYERSQPDRVIVHPSRGAPRVTC